MFCCSWYVSRRGTLKYKATMCGYAEYNGEVKPTVKSCSSTIGNCIDKAPQQGSNWRSLNKSRSARRAVFNWKTLFSTGKHDTRSRFLGVIVPISRRQAGPYHPFWGSRPLCPGTTVLAYLGYFFHASGAKTGPLPCAAAFPPQGSQGS